MNYVPWRSIWRRDGTRDNRALILCFACTPTPRLRDIILLYAAVLRSVSPHVSVCLTNAVDLCSLCVGCEWVYALSGVAGGVISA